MGRELDQLVRSSYMGSIDSMEEVAETVTKFINLSLAEILGTVNARIKKIIDSLAVSLMKDEWNLSKEYVESLEYAELLCLIDNTKIDPAEFLDNDRQGYNNIGVELPQPAFRYLGLNDIYILLRAAEKTGNFVKLFMSVNVHSFFAYLKSIGNAGRISGVWNTLLERADAMEINIGPVTSIRDVLYKADEKWKSWNPWTSLSDYYGKVLVIFEIYSCLLIDCFKYAYPEKFHLKNIINKYSSYEADDFGQ